MEIFIAIISVILTGFACVGVDSLFRKKLGISKEDNIELINLRKDYRQALAANEILEKDLRKFVEFKGLKKGDKLYYLSDQKIKNGVVTNCIIYDPYGSPEFCYAIDGKMFNSIGYRTKEELIESLKTD